MIKKIISGGQTGVDRAALDAALFQCVPCGGWCPKGRRAEDGPIPLVYPLRETASEAYEERTKQNVEESDGTLILTRGRLSGGTALTLALTQKKKKPYLIVDLKKPPFSNKEIFEWIRKHRIRVLNVAGPRESLQPGIYKEAKKLLSSLLAEL